MIDELVCLTIIAVLGIILLLFYLYVASIEKVLVAVGFSTSEASTIIFGTLFFGWITIPLFPYEGWWIGISIGGALIPTAICVNLLLKRRIEVGEAFLGITVVAYITYNITRAEEGVGIVADVPIAFAPALAAGLFAMCIAWMDVSKAAPLAYVSGVLGTLIGADVFRLGEYLSFEAPEDEFALLSIGGANIYDMVYLTGIVAVLIALLIVWILKRQEKLWFGSPSAEFRRGAQGLPYAKDLPAARKIAVKKGRAQ